MKTKQEQIEEMAGKMKRCFEKNRLLNFKWFAEALVQAGYGDVSEYKAEIERLNKESKIRCMSEEFAKSAERFQKRYKAGFSDGYFKGLCDGGRGVINEKLLEPKIKQAKIDVLNELKSKSYVNDYCREVIEVEKIDELLKEYE